MKKIVFLMAAMVLGLATPSQAANVMAEVRLGDTRSVFQNGHQDSTEYKAEYNDNYSFVTYGAEIQVRQNSNEGALGSRVSLRSGVQIPQIFGYTPKAYLELGKGLSVGNDAYFWGAVVGVSHPIMASLTGDVGFRRRQNFQDTNLFTENRFNLGVTYDITKNTALGAQYYVYTGGTVNRQEVGLRVVRSF